MEEVDWREDKGRVIAYLLAENDGAPLQLVSQYADQWSTYREAQSNIDEHGALVFHPRTGAPVQNPYLGIRDAALRHLVRLLEEGVTSTTALWTFDTPDVPGANASGAGCG